MPSRRRPEGARQLLDLNSASTSRPHEPPVRARQRRRLAHKTRVGTDVSLEPSSNTRCAVLVTGLLVSGKSLGNALIMEGCRLAVDIGGTFTDVVLETPKGFF